MQISVSIILGVCINRYLSTALQVFFVLSKTVNCTELTDVQVYRVSQEECARLREGVPYVKVYRYNKKKHLYPKLNGYGDNGQRSLKL